jgi:hypothetical protein
LSPVSPANDLLQLKFAHSNDVPAPSIELRVDGARVAPATGRRAGKDADLEPLPKQAAIRKPAIPKGARPAGRSGILAEDAQHYRARTLRWDLQKYRGQTVQLMLSISINTQTKGLVWHELAMKKDELE